MTMLSVSIDKCDQDSLSTGQTCMEGEELVKYFGDKAISIFLMDIKVDYENI